MKKTICLTLLLALCLLAQAQSQRQRLLLNHDWRFAKGHAADPAADFNYGRALSFTKTAFVQEAIMLEADQESKLSIPHSRTFDDSAWDSISLPHDWGMALGYDKNQLKVKGYRTLGGRSPQNSVGWYRKTFSTDLKKGCRYTLEFEGVFRDAEVWLNGIYLGREESGYVPITFDVTESLDYADGAKNVITVRVDATQSELWSYEGAGIYRNVWLTRTAPVHVAQWGTLVTTDVQADKQRATVTALVEVDNELDGSRRVTVRNTVMDDTHRPVASAQTEVDVPSLETGKATTQLDVPNPRLWSPSSPALYVLRTELLVDGQVTDSYDTRFGIRTIRFDADRGFFLNGERVQIQGVCCHQDHAGVGTAVPERLNTWRIARLKEMGANAYRPSHNPPTEAVLNACDSLGLLVLDEARMLSASDEALSQLSTLIRRDRNHPSVILWCLGNEEPAIQGTEMGRTMVERMKQVQRKLDPSRLCTAAMNGKWGKGFTEAVDVQGCNYYHIGDIDRLHRQFPSLPILLTEEASTLTTRGIYHTSAEQAFHQSYDHDRPGWGATAQEWMRFVDQRPFIAGAFVWTGFDYGGESTLHYWPGVVSHFGIYDYCGFPKDAFWYYKAWWTDEPVLHILPHWNGTGTDSVDVHLYTNMDEVELRLNGRSLGKRKVGKFDIPAWRVKYVPGKLEARGRKDGKTYKETVETTGAPAAVELSSETGPALRADGSDVAVITVRVVDKKGRVVPTAGNNVQFDIENGHILGVGNGHPSSHERDVFAPGEQVHRNAFNGYAQVIVAADRPGLPLKLTATSEGLQTATLSLDTMPADGHPGHAGSPDGKPQTPAQR